MSKDGKEVLIAIVAFALIILYGLYPRVKPSECISMHSDKVACMDATGTYIIKGEKK